MECGPIPPFLPADYPGRMGPGDVRVSAPNTDDVEAPLGRQGEAEVPGVTFTAEARPSDLSGPQWRGRTFRVMGCNFCRPRRILIELNQMSGVTSPARRSPAP